MLKFVSKNCPLIIPFLLYTPLAFLGYGYWIDIYSVLDTGTNFLKAGVWIPSRNPGYFVHEFFTMILNAVGGSVLTNLGTIAMALIAIYCFILICKKFDVPHYKIIVLAMSVNPTFWINAASTTDHIWALGFILSGFVLILRKNYFIGSLLFGLSIGSRLSSFVAVIGILAFFWFTAKEDRRKIILATVVSGILSMLFYVPSLINAHYTLGFLAPLVGGSEFWTPILRIGRFVYKNIYLWGLPASIMLVPMVIIIIKKWRDLFSSKWFAISILSAIMVVGYEALYLQYPLKIAYLLPMLPFILIILAIGLKDHPKLLVAFTVLILIHNFVNFNIAKPNFPGRATSATFELAVEKGYLIEDVENRLKLYRAGCNSNECAQNVYKEFKLGVDQ